MTLTELPYHLMSPVAFPHAYFIHAASTFEMLNEHLGMNQPYASILNVCEQSLTKVKTESVNSNPTIQQ